jgi:hypothetical protein
LSAEPGSTLSVVSIADLVSPLTELRLWEIPRVTFPMNQPAHGAAVNALSDDERAADGDPALLENGDNAKSFLAELMPLAEQVQDLASV